jgi:hypothetical protein
MIRGNTVTLVGDCRVSVWFGLSFDTEVDKDNFIDRQDALAGNHVPHLRTHRQRGSTESRSCQAHLDQIPLDCGTDEIDFRYVLCDRPAITELNDGVNRCLFVDPLQQASAEEGAVSV